MAKLPAFQFYPGDWMKDPDLRRCSCFARGLLMDLLCLCFESSVRGVLCNQDGSPWSVDDIQRAAGVIESDVFYSALAELETKNVLSRDGNGCLVSRRMVRDEHLRQIRAECGSKGGSKTGSKQQANSKQKGQQKGPPSSSSSSSSSSSVIDTPVVPFRLDWSSVTFPDGCDTERVRAAVLEWLSYRRAIKKPYKMPAKQVSLLLAEHGADLPAAVSTSIANGWIGCFRGNSGKAEPEEPSAPFVSYDYDAYLESQKLEPKVKP
ncbi:MAG: hypothetical protein WC114_11015 [Smithellaceae bacterium]